MMQPLVLLLLEGVASTFLPRPVACIVACLIGSRRLDFASPLWLRGRGTILASSFLECSRSFASAFPDWPGRVSPSWRRGPSISPQSGCVRIRCRIWGSACGGRRASLVMFLSRWARTSPAAFWRPRRHISSVADCRDSSVLDMFAAVAASRRCSVRPWSLAISGCKSSILRRFSYICVISSWSL